MEGAIDGKPLSAVPRPTKLFRSTTYDLISLKNSGFVGEGKTVLFTGGATGVGFALAQSFARAGVRRVILVSRSLENLGKAKEQLEKEFPSVEVVTISASITAYDRMTEVLQEVNSKYGIDILVHCAVVINDATPVDKLSQDTIEHIFATNVYGAANIFKAYSNLEYSGQKTLINVNSAAAGLVFPLNSIYGASKAAAGQLVHHIYTEQASKPEKERMRVFMFHPGQYFTPSVAEFVGEDWIKWDDIELAKDFAVWLAGTHSDFLQGRFLWATWDLEELIEKKEKIIQNPHFLQIGLNLALEL